MLLRNPRQAKSTGLFLNILNGYMKIQIPTIQIKKMLKGSQLKN